MNKKEIKFEYGFESVNGIVKKKYYIHEIPNIKEKCDMWNVLPIVYVRQFTGIKDKNNIEIYEGDIFTDMLNTKDLGIVKFGEYNHCFDKQQLIDFGNHIGFYVEFNYKGTRKDLKYWAKNSEIIGNIYQNPELLKP